MQYIELFENGNSKSLKSSRFGLSMILVLFFSLISVSAFSASTIKSIQFTKEKNGYSLVFKNKGPLRYSSSILNDPPRIVINFPDTESGMSTDDVEVQDNPLVSKIHTSQKLEPGNVSLEVVIELKQAIDFSLSPLSGGFALHLVPKSAATTDPSKSGPPSKVPAKNPPATTNGTANRTTDPKNATATTVSPTPPPPGATNSAPPKLVPPQAEERRLEIGPEDLLDINVFDLPQFSSQTRVGGDGTITMPLIGSIKVSGLTKQEAEKKIAAELESKYVNNANVAVAIKEYKSKQVTVFGAVKNPGAFYVLSSRTLLQLISDAGGLTENAGPRCFIFRPGQARIEIDLTALMINGDQSKNIPIYPGDVINFATGGKVVVYVLGQVRKPGPVEIPYGSALTLLTAVAKAGGISENGKKSGIQIRHKDETGKITVVKVNLKDILSGKKPDVELKAGDVIEVPQSFF